MLQTNVPLRAGSAPASVTRASAARCKPRHAAASALRLVALAASGHVLAQATPAGLWRTIDDSTGKPRGLVEITETSWLYQGRLVKSFMTDEGTPKVCGQCPDARRSQPLIGMIMLTGLRKTGDNTWRNGEILDPGNGKIYKSKVSLAEGGTKLDVRGYIGISLPGRTQTWERMR